MLAVENIHTYYGNIQSLKGVSISVKEGEICTLIGSNGAGKTTLLRTIQGLLRPREGRIFFNQKPIESLSTEQIVNLGISQSPEGRLIFPKMSVLENLEMGAFSRRDRLNIKSDIEKILTLFPRLRERITQKAGTMSGGEQQMLAMGRALMARPKLLLLDEPSMGLAPILVNQIFDIIQDINQEGMTILLVEQNARKALKIAKTGYVLQTGKVVKSGSAKELQSDPEVRRIYLGEE
ncbi:ABC transporter ATP-binding protein [Merismopedia glauca]|uniref:ABC transporter ATP-binding protein n=1 Tax=Merismopedia glauca CCAP 1448/3 TaxID=1296344 RepID=A0A2T1BXS1_9CYAN|nr:ABC transporter ATP-binding protein [Merismopedia glauca]PSB00809.1 ABC transporter ATP-binding protein [Merismopedia glauca CCAP 1448/3]